MHTAIEMIAIAAAAAADDDIADLIILSIWKIIEEFGMCALAISLSLF